MVDWMIETHDLRKTFGDFQALDGVSLQVPKGSIYGFLGHNGAGKTTTMRILTTLTRPNSGTARVNGYDVLKDKRAVRQSIGYMPDEFGVYEDLRVWEYLDFFSACYDIPENERKDLVARLLELVELTDRREDLVDKLSRGMKQRLSLARTLAHDPEVLILDEPASGLDPRARVEIRELLAHLAQLGKTIFFSTHILADVEELCSHIGIIQGGKMLAQGSLSELKSQLMESREIFVTLNDSSDLERAKQASLGIQGVRDIALMLPKAGRTRFKVVYHGDDEGIGALHRALVSANIPLMGFYEEEKSLETIFISVTEGVTAKATP